MRRSRAEGDLRGSLDAVVADSIRPVSAGLAVAYGALGLFRLFTPDHPGHAVHLPAAVATAALMVTLYVALGRWPLGPGLGHPAAAALAGIALANSALDLAVESPDESVLLIFLVVGAGALFLSWRWLAVVLASTAASWLTVAVARWSSGPGERLEFGLFLAIAMGLAAFVHAVRLRGFVGLERTRRFFGGLIEGAGDMILVIDREGVVTYLSPSVERTLGWTPQDLVGRPGLELVHEEDLPGTAELLARTVSGASAVGPVEVRVRHRDGAWRHVEAVATNLLDDPAVGGIVVNARVVTERGKIEEAVRETNERLGAIVHASPVAIVAVDAQGVVTMWNPAAERLFGWTRDEAVGRPVPFVPEEGLEEFRALFGRVLGSEQLSGVEVRRRRKDGAPIDISLSTACLRDAGGRVTGVVGVLVDLADRKRAEEALRESEAKYRVLVEEIPAILVLDRPDRSMETVYISPQVETILGISQQDWMARPDRWEEYLHPDDRQRVVEAHRRFVHSGDPIYANEYRMVRPDGEVVWISDRTRFVRDEDDRPLAIQSVMLDVTEGKRAEEELRRAEEKYRVLVEDLPAIPYIDRADDSLETIYVGPQIADILGVSQEEYLTDPHLWERHIHAEDRQRALDAVYDLIRTDRETDYLEYRWVRPDGRVVWINDRTVKVRDADGRVLMFQGVMFDVTQRKEAEEALRESEARFRALVEQIPAAFHISGLDETASTIYISPQVEAILGYAAEEWVADDELWVKLLHPDDRERALAINRHHVTTHEPMSTDYRMIARDGRVVWIHDESVVMRDEQGRPLHAQGILLDVTDSKRAEEALRESEAELRGSLEVLRRTDEERRKLLSDLISMEEEARGRMAEGIQDESLQHMAAVGIRLEALKRGLSDPQQLGAIDRLGRSVEQAVGRLRHLMLELRPRTLDRDGLGAALRQYLGSIAPGTGLEFALDDQLGEELPLEIRGTAYRIALEVIANVRDHAKASHVEVELRERDGGVLVRVIDDGVGFDPTAAADSPGLVTMRERAELAGGWLRVRSAPGAGSAVEFWLHGGEVAPATGEGEAARRLTP